MTPRVQRWRVLDLCRLNEDPCRYLFREYGEDDDAWKLVVSSPVCESLVGTLSAWLVD